jgi:hypothetical protein
VDEVGDGPGSRACWGLACLTRVLLCIGIAFSPYIVAVVCLTHVLLSETDNNEEEIEKVFDKILCRLNDSHSVVQHPGVLSCFPLTIRFHFLHTFSHLFSFYRATCFVLNGHLQALVHVS